MSIRLVSTVPGAVRGHAHDDGEPAEEVPDGGRAAAHHGAGRIFASGDLGYRGRRGAERVRI